MSADVVILPVVRVERYSAEPTLRQQADAVQGAIDVYRQIKSRLGLSAREAERYDDRLVAARETLLRLASQP